MKPKTKTAPEVIERIIALGRANVQHKNIRCECGVSQWLVSRTLVIAGLGRQKRTQAATASA